MSTEIRDIVCDVAVPWDGHNVHVPTSWLDDPRGSWEGTGLALFVLSHAAGTVVSGALLAERHHPADPPLGEMLRELEEGGYLVREDVGDSWRYRLVHPDRLPPLPAVAS